MKYLPVLTKAIFLFLITILFLAILANLSGHSGVFVKLMNILFVLLVAAVFFYLLDLRKNNNE